MSSPRYFHTATALLDGRVLVAGGQSSTQDGGALDSAELYDPASGSGSAAGRMSSRRAGHTATLLADGRVLVAGGMDPHGLPNAGADLFDPTDGRWHRCSALLTARSEHTATLLSSGLVVLTGGRSIQGSLIGATDSVEIFDPFSGGFTAGLALGEGRYGHTAVLLDNGTVLVAGGTPAQSELYQPGARAHAVAYLETWGRLITVHEDPSIGEVALNGADTTVRLRNVAQVRVLPVGDDYAPGGLDCASAAALLPGTGSGALTTLAR